MRRRLVSSVAMLALLSVLPAAPASGATTGRLAGASRIDTAAAIAEHAVPGTASAVYLARADVFADALAAGTLTDGPVLLVPSCGAVPEVVAAQIDRLDPAEVVALGGTNAICDDLLAAAAAGRASLRVAGPSRIDTAIEIARRAFPDGAASAYIARGADSPDAVAGGALTDGPILLVTDDGQVPDAVVGEIARLDPQRVVALGGSSAITQGVLDDAGVGRATDRLAGASRIDTAAAIADEAFPGTAAEVYLARADVFADAVAAGSLTRGPVLLVPTCGTVPAPVAQVISRLGPASVIALGGTAAICDALLAEAAAGAPAPDQTRVMGPAERMALRTVDADGTLRFDAGALPDPPPWAPGDVLVSEPAPAAPSGLLVRVEQVRRDGPDLLVATSPAALTDAIGEGQVSAEIPLGPDDVEASTPLPDGVALQSARAGFNGLSGGWTYQLDDFVLADLDGNHGTTDDQVRADGLLDVQLALLPRIDIGTRLEVPPVYLAGAEFLVRVDQRAELDVTATYEGGLQGTRELVRHDLRPITIFIGPVPVVLTPTVTLSVNASGSIEATASWGMTQTASLTAGASYTDGSGWSPVHDATFAFDHREPAVQGSVDAVASVVGRVDVDLYGVAGPHIEVSPFVRFEGASDPCPSLGLFAGYHVDVGLDTVVPALDDLPLLNLRVLEDERTLFEATSGCQGYQWSGTFEVSSSFSETFSGGGVSGGTSRSDSATFTIPAGSVPSREINYDVYEATASYTYRLTSNDPCLTEVITAAGTGVPAELGVNQWIDQDDGGPLFAVIPGVTFTRVQSGVCATTDVPVTWTEPLYLGTLNGSAALGPGESATVTGGGPEQRGDGTWQFRGTETFSRSESNPQPDGNVTRTRSQTARWDLTSPTGPGLPPISN